MTDTSWQPSAAIDVLKQRAAVLAVVRHFFAERGVLEVETPLLARYSVTDPYMEVLAADNPVGNKQPYYLQTSPEYAMKRLLAAGSGPIYQICKAFRKGECSSRHNPEFTMLEWYRPGFSLFDLMDEVAALLKVVLGEDITVHKIAYRDLFLEYLQIDPLKVDCETVETAARQRLDVQMSSNNMDDWLNLLMAEVIEPKLKARGPTFVYHYPASQAALSRLESNDDGLWLAQRFELYAGGLELANGYDELTDAVEQEQRFAADLRQRQLQNKSLPDVDKYLLAAMQAGLPECSGVAIGLDRLLMLALGVNTIQAVQAFAENGDV